MRWPLTSEDAAEYAINDFDFIIAGIPKIWIAVISHVTANEKYSELALIGFSLGGNVILKYLGERGTQTNSLITKAVAFSVPCDLESSSNHLAGSANRIYLKRFLRLLRKKIRMKMAIMPEQINDHDYKTIKTFKEFDDRYTAPMFGFSGAEDYWRKASCKPFLASISIPTLLINAADDPFLTDLCYPTEEAKNNPRFFLEIPKFGGHVVWVQFCPRVTGLNQNRLVPAPINMICTGHPLTHMPFLSRWIFSSSNFWEANRRAGSALV